MVTPGIPTVGLSDWTGSTGEPLLNDLSHRTASPYPVTPHTVDTPAGRVISSAVPAAVSFR
jgi:hypothetical protein